MITKPTPSGEPGEGQTRCTTQGWDGNFELPSGESSHSLGSWSFFSPDGLFIYLDIVDPPVTEGKLSAPAMVVTFTYTDG